MTDGGDRLSEEEAQRVWKRAADLQASVAEPQLRAPTVSPESAHQPGYSLAQVREAAAEVGIAPEFLARALAEGPDADASPKDPIDRWAARLGGRGPRSLVVSRRFDRSADAVHAAVQRVFARHHLVLIDSHGEPLEGGELVYALPSAITGTTDFVFTDLVSRARVEELHLRLLALDDATCVATVSTPLGAARRAHVGVGAALTASAGLVGAWAVGALGAALVIPLSIGAAAAAAAIGAAALVGLGGGGTLGIAGSRAAHRSGQRRGTAALERLLQAVAMDLRGLTSEGPSPGRSAIASESSNRTSSTD